jgi:hypothetical protein
VGRDEGEIEEGESAKCIFVSGRLWKYLGVIRPESQGSQIPEFTGHMHWPLGTSGSTSEKSGWT